MENNLVKEYNMDFINNRILDQNIRIKALLRDDILANKKLSNNLAENGNTCDI